MTFPTPSRISAKPCGAGVFAITLAAFFAGCLVTSPVGAATVRGFSSCADWLEERKKEDSDMEESWVMGYLSGANMFMTSRKDIMKMMEPKEIHAWIDGYCRANPTGDTADAAGALVKELQKR